MALKIFTGVLTLTDVMDPVDRGVGAKNIVWLTLKARTNTFMLGTNITAIDGPIINTSIDIPISEMVGKTQTFSLDDLYWKNAIAGQNCVVEIIGMKNI